MFKVLVVDDEDLERNALKDLLEKKYNDKMLIYTACSGEEAVNVSIEICPDIILIDIHMSDLNGIEASRIILKSLSGTRIIVITAYDIFEYAQKSIVIGIKDFLLKPVNTEKLYQAIDNQIIDIELQRKALKEMLDAKENLKKIKPAINDLIIYQIINDRIIPDALNEYFNILEIDFKSGTLFIIDIRRNEQIKTFIDGEIIKSRAMEIICQEYPMKSYMMSGNGVFSRIIGIILNSETMQNEYETRLQNIDFVNKLYVTLKSSLFTDFKIGISMNTQRLEGLSECYRQAVFALNHGDEFINHYSDISLIDQSGYPQSVEDEILSQILNTDSLKTGALFEEFIASINGDSNNTISNVKSAVIQLVMQIVKKSTNNLVVNYYSYNEALLEELVICKNIQDVKRIGLELLLDLGDKIEKGFQNKSNMVINKVKRFIDENYSKPLSLEAIAAHCNISPFHLSRMFKKETTWNIFDYLNNVRIERAKDFLLTTEYTIKEICYETGFNDPNYFCKVFKKITNITPSTYRDLNKK